MDSFEIIIGCVLFVLALVLAVTYRGMISKPEVTKSNPSDRPEVSHDFPFASNKIIKPLPDLMSFFISSDQLYSGSQLMDYFERHGLVIDDRGIFNKEAISKNQPSCLVLQGLRNQVCLI